MTLVWNRKSTIFGGAFLFVLLLSLAVFFLFSDNQEQFVLFFPNNSNHKLTGEARFVPREHTLEANVTELVDGLILGPEQLRHDRALAKQTRIRSLMVRGDQVYLDFSPDILFPQGDTTAGFSESLAAVRKTIHFNFPQIKKIIITVDGQLPKSELIANS